MRWMLTVLTAAAMSAAAAMPPPDFPEELLAEPTVKLRPVGALSLGALEVRFEETTLAQAKLAAGTGSIGERGHAGGHILWLCYAVPQHSRFDRLWLISSGEMGGNEHRITQIAAVRSAGMKPMNDCPELPEKLQPVSLSTGLWLGTDVRHLTATLGPPSRHVGDWMSYLYVGKKAAFNVTCSGGWDVMNWLVTRSSDGMISAIHAGQVASC